MPVDISIPGRLLLASRSPQRQQLLREAGYDFVVEPADVNEEDYPRTMLPADVAVQLAQLKANTVAQRFSHDTVLAADTVVAFGDLLLGKPQSPEHAAQMLTLLSGTTHLAITGVAVARANIGLHRAARVMSAVRMRMLTRDEINRYVESGEWIGKAGGYGIQDADLHAGILPTTTNEPFITRVSGCHTNIIGLPMTTTKKMLEAVGVHPAKLKDDETRMNTNEHE